MTTKTKFLNNSEALFPTKPLNHSRIIPPSTSFEVQFAHRTKFSLCVDGERNLLPIIRPLLSMPVRTDAPTLPWNYIAKLVCIGDSGESLVKFF